MTKPRKREKYTPELAVLVRAVMPTISERKSKSALREFDLARDDLLSMYFDYQREGKLHELPFQVRILCEQWIQSDAGVRKGGRPSNDHQRLLVAVAVSEAIAAIAASATTIIGQPNLLQKLQFPIDDLPFLLPGRQRHKPKYVTKAIQHVRDTLNIDGKRVALSRATIRRLYYDPDPEWRRALKLTLAERCMKAWWTPQVEQAPKGAAVGLPDKDFQWWIAGCPT